MILPCDPIMTEEALDDHSDWQQQGPLPLDVRLDRAGQHVVRARLFFELWSYFEEDATRAKIIETMQDYSEFFRFTSHAYLVAYIIYIAGIFDKRRDTISVTRLASEMKTAELIKGQQVAEIDALLAEAAPIADKVTILRHNAFAHRSAMIGYDDVFKMAAVTPGQLRELTELVLKIVNRLLLARGLNEQDFAPLPREDAEKIMRALGECPR
jgi:AbiU2